MTFIGAFMLFVQGGVQAFIGFIGEFSGGFENHAQGGVVGEELGAESFGGHGFAQDVARQCNAGVAHQPIEAEPCDM